MSGAMSDEWLAEIRAELQPEPRYAIGTEYRDMAFELLAEVDRLRALLGTAVVEHAVRFGSGDRKIRSDRPDADRIEPLKDWIGHEQRQGRIVDRRTVIVVEDWKRVPKRRPGKLDGSGTA